MLTDLHEYQQAAAIVMRLGGAARELVRAITPNELIAGGTINGVPVAPVSYIIAGLQIRFAALEDETRLAAGDQILSFRRRRNESINATLSRYEGVRTRAYREGNFVQTTEVCAIQLLRACNVTPQQIVQFLQPFQGRLPTTEAEFSVLQGHMRRVGHIMERSPNNLGQLLHGGHQARPGEYFTDAPSGDYPEGSHFYGNSHGAPETQSSYMTTGGQWQPQDPSWQQW